VLDFKEWLGQYAPDIPGIARLHSMRFFVYVSGTAGGLDIEPSPATLVELLWCRTG
jgi:hypothetical protein